MKTHAVGALRAFCRFETLLEIADLPRATFFYHQALWNRPDPQAELKVRIQAIFTEVHGRYGHRRIQARLVADGWRVAKKTVLKMMRQLGIVCQVRRRKRYTSYRGEVGKVAPNLLNRDFTATAPNQKWVTDVTEFRIGSHKVYLSPVMDLFDRQIIAWSIGVSPSRSLTLSALRDAVATLPSGAAPIVHSDQRMHYQHRSWQNLLALAGATQSMSRKGNCLDNAVMESFFGHLKEECFHHTWFASVEMLIDALHDYIGWYNTGRISSRLKGMTPVQYRTQALAA